MRILHTADWHLGHTLRDVSRRFEHERFLEWLLDVVEEQAVDALLIAGDVFDASNPPNDAVALWYRFLAEARRRFPSLGVVATGGNHDSAARLDAPGPILDSFGLHVLGGARVDGRPRDPADFVVPLRDAEGRVAAVVAAVPFLRPVDLPRVDLPRVDSGTDPAPSEQRDELVEGVRAFYAAVFDAARRCTPEGAALVAMGHLYLAHTELSELSERKVLGGNQHALPGDFFPADVAYVALGHLHLAQAVGRDTVRYSGSPIPLSLPERTYPHQVVLVTLESDQVTEVAALRVPRSVPFLRVPPTGYLPLPELEEALAALELDEAPAGAPRAFIEVGVALDAPQPELRRRLATALDGKWAMLARIDVQSPSSRDSTAAGEAKPTRRLGELTVDDVFRRAWLRAFDSEPEPRLLAALHEVVDAVSQFGDPPSGGQRGNGKRGDGGAAEAGVPA